MDKYNSQSRQIKFALWANEFKFKIGDSEEGASSCNDNINPHLGWPNITNTAAAKTFTVLFTKVSGLTEINYEELWYLIFVVLIYVCDTGKENNYHWLKLMF